MTLFETNYGYTVMDSIATSLKAIARELHLRNKLAYAELQAKGIYSSEMIRLSPTEIERLKKE